MIDRNFEFYYLWHQALLRNDAFINCILYRENMREYLQPYEKIEACEITLENIVSIFGFTRFHKHPENEIMEWFSDEMLRKDTYCSENGWIRIKTPNDMLEVILKVLNQSYKLIKLDSNGEPTASALLWDFYHVLDFMHITSVKPFTAWSDKKFYPDEIKRYLGVFDLRAEGYTYKEILANDYLDIYPFNKHVKERVSLNNNDIIYAKRELERDYAKAKRLIENALEGDFPNCQKLQCVSMHPL